MICEVDAPFQRVLFSFHDLYTLTPLYSTDDDLLDPIKIGVMGFGHSNLEICVIGTFWFSKRITKQREEAFSSRPNRCVQNWGTHYDVTLQGWFVVSRKIVNTLFRTINAQFLQRQWLVVFLFRAHFLWAVKELENRRLMCCAHTAQYPTLVTCKLRHTMNVSKPQRCVQKVAIPFSFTNRIGAAWATMRHAYLWHQGSVCKELYDVHT